MNILDRIRITFGLFWHRHTLWIIAEYLAVILFILAASYWLAAGIKAGNEYFERVMNADVQIKVERERADHYESVVLACLRHDVVKVGNDIRICEL